MPRRFVSPPHLSALPALPALSALPALPALPALSALLLLAGVMVSGCVEKDLDAPASGPRPLTQAEKERVSKHLLKEAPASLSHPVGADMDGKIIYLGLHAQEEYVTPGKPFSVVHYFQVKQAVPGWKLFVHTNGPGQSDFRNFDHVPVFGLHRVSAWKPGEIVEDRHTILVPREVSYDTVDIYVGIWRGRQRLKVRSGPQDGSNRVLAARIPVRRGPAGARPVADPLPEYVVRRATGKIVIDGKAEEEDWKKAPATSVFRDSLTGAAKPQRTEARLLWDEDHLYLFFTAEDEDVWGTVTKADDAKMWTEQVFEILLDADGDGADYIEIQVNPRGTLFDAYLPRPGQSQVDWQSGVVARVHVDGTLENRDDKDRGWQAEIAIPWAAVKGRSQAAMTLPPPVGARLRANFFRTDTPKGGALQAWAWSPTRTSTFHALGRFGTLVMGDPSGRVAAPEAPEPAAPPAMSPAASPAMSPAASPAMSPATSPAMSPATPPPPRPPVAPPGVMKPQGGMP